MVPITANLTCDTIWQSAKYVVSQIQWENITKSGHILVPMVPPHKKTCLYAEYKVNGWERLQRWTSNQQSNKYRKLCVFIYQQMSANFKEYKIDGSIQIIYIYKKLGFSLNKL